MDFFVIVFGNEMFYRAMPESLLWLLVTNRTRERDQLLRRIAKTNKARDSINDLKFQDFKVSDHYYVASF